MSQYLLRSAYGKLTDGQNTDPVEAYFLALFEVYFDSRRRDQGIKLSHPIVINNYNGYADGLLMYSAKNKSITFTSAYTCKTLFIATKDSLYIPHHAFNNRELKTLGIYRFAHNTRARKRDLYLMSLKFGHYTKVDALQIAERIKKADPHTTNILTCFSSGDVTFHKGGKVDRKEDLVRTVINKELYNKIQKTKRDVYALLSAELLIGDIDISDEQFSHKQTFSYNYSTSFIPRINERGLIDIFTDVEKTRDILIKAAIWPIYSPKRDGSSRVSYSLRSSVLPKLAPRNYTYIDNLAAHLGIVKYL